MCGMNPETPEEIPPFSDKLRKHTCSSASLNTEYSPILIYILCIFKESNASNFA